MSALNWLDWLVIGAYLVFVLAVGVLFARRASKSTDEYFISGRNLPWWLAGTSMVATSFASDTPLVITGWVRTRGIAENWQWWCFALGHMLSVFLLARLWRRAEIVTDVELTELRYSGRSAAALRAFRAAYLAIPINCIIMAWVMVAMVKLMGVLFRFPPVVAVAICIVLATFYSVLSGFWGVVVTDLVQFGIAIAGAIGLCALVVRSFGSLADLQQQAQANSPLGQHVLDFFPKPTDGPAGSGDFWSGAFFAFLMFIAVQWWANKNADGGGVIVQRMASAKDERHALLATLWFCVAHYALRPWPWILVALASLAVFPNLADAEAAYPEMIVRFVPAGLMGLILTSFLAAFMSTIDTHANLSASYIVNDVHRRFIRPGASQAHYVWVSRIVSVAFMLISSAIALKAGSISDLFRSMLAFSGGLGSVYLLRWFWWRINAWSEISAMIASPVIASALYIRGGLPYAPILAITVAGSTIVWLAVTFLTPPVSRERLVAFYRKVRPYGAWGPIAAAAPDVSPTRLARQLRNCLAGTVMVLGATFGVGKLLLGSPLQGSLYLGAALIGAVVIWPDVAGRHRRPRP
jgi:Na+/proline symporter